MVHSKILSHMQSEKHEIFLSARTLNFFILKIIFPCLQTTEINFTKKDPQGPFCSGALQSLVPLFIHINRIAQSQVQSLTLGAAFVKLHMLVTALVAF